MLVPISLSAANLGWSAPDGHAVLRDISISFAAERTGIGKSTLLTGVEVVSMLASEGRSEPSGLWP